MESAYEKKVKAQFRRWARDLLKINPDYVIDPDRLVPYVRGPNWDNPNLDYAHYRDMVKAYGDELLAEFERLRGGTIDDGIAYYRGLLARCGFDPKTGRFLMDMPKDAKGEIRTRRILLMKSYYFTFGCGHPLREFVQRIFASCEAKARETMNRFYADKWAFCYGPYEANDPMDYVTGMVNLRGYEYCKIEKDLAEGETL